MVLIGPNNEIIAYNNDVIAGLVEFTLDTDPHIKTVYSCANVFPRPSGHRVKAGAVDEYPLHIYAGDEPNAVLVGVKGKLYGVVLRRIQVHLHATKKRIIRLTTYLPLPEDSKLILLDLGVELIVEPQEEGGK